MATCEHLSGDKEIALPSLHFLAVAEGEARPDEKYEASLDEKYEASPDEKYKASPGEKYKASSIEKYEASSDEKYVGKSPSLGSVDFYLVAHY